MTIFEKVLWFLHLDRLYERTKLKRAQKAQEAYFKMCEENKDGWVS